MTAKKLSYLSCLFLCILGLVYAAPAAATTLSFTDTTTKQGFNIEYALDITLSEGIYNAVFTINSSGNASEPWYIGAFDFKFFDGNGNDIPDILSLSAAPGAMDIWGITDNATPNVSIQGWKREAGSAGFYLTDLAADQIYDNAKLGVLVSGTNSASFTFTFAKSGILNEVYMPFQVAYFDGAKSKSGLYFGQLSADLGIPVPEPATMLLLASGLAGLAAFRKKSKK